MYACICQGLKEKDVRTSVQHGAGTVAEVFRAQGCRPDCGKCVGSIRATIKDEIEQDQAFLMAAE